ncbi:hypothetical protein Tco_1141914 [Tanacetum coccineum]
MHTGSHGLLAQRRKNDNKTTLNFGKYTSIEPIPNDSFPEHYFKFIAYNEVQDKVDVSGATLTAGKFDMKEYANMPKPVVIVLSATPATYYYLNPNIPEVHHILNVYCFRIIIDDGTAATTITCFSPEAHTFAPDCNELVNVVKNKDNRCLPNALKKFKNTTYIFQYRFGTKAKLGNPKFSLDVAFKTSPQPLIGLPAPESATTPQQEVLEQPSSTTTPTPSESDPCQSTEDYAKGLDTSSETTKKTTKRELFRDTKPAKKKPRQET